MVLRDVPRPTCGPSDVLIRVHHAGVCGTDLHIWEWDSWASQRLKPPWSSATNSPERSSSWDARPRRPGCWPWATRSPPRSHRLRPLSSVPAGRGALCQRTQIIGVDRDGAFADFISMPASNVMRLDGIPTEVGAIMDPMGNAVHTVLEARFPAARCWCLAAARSAASRWGWPGGGGFAGDRERLQPDAAGAGARHGCAGTLNPARTTCWPG
jgi:threonine 3-dehydrogenase